MAGADEAFCRLCCGGSVRSQAAAGKVGEVKRGFL